MCSICLALGLPFLYLFTGAFSKQRLTTKTNLHHTLGIRSVQVNYCSQKCSQFVPHLAIDKKSPHTSPNSCTLLPQFICFIYSYKGKNTFLSVYPQSYIARQ